MGVLCTGSDLCTPEVIVSFMLMFSFCCDRKF
uniref:Uncharacterized protein n=1 Tax=Musa acuminata subsp. malaccensis TaxID=214687 RepID=A0A804HYC3_MUSAM